MSDSFDKSSTLRIDGEILNRSSFKKTAGDKLARRIGNEADDPLHVVTGKLIQGVDYDLISVTYPTTESEVYIYSLLAVTVSTVTVTYSDNTKVSLLSVSFT